MAGNKQYYRNLGDVLDTSKIPGNLTGKQSTATLNSSVIYYRVTNIDLLNANQIFDAISVQTWCGGYSD
jgi:hypothetical protein